MARSKMFQGSLKYEVWPRINPSPKIFKKASTEYIAKKAMSQV